MAGVQTTRSRDSRTRPTPGPALRAASWLAVVTGVGTATLTVGHSGVTVPLVSALGPGGGDPVWPAAAGFAVATALFAAIAVGLFRRRAWAWPLATVVNGLVAASGVLQFRGAVSAVGVALGLASLVLLLTPAVRRELLPRD